ncbi:unnamed protein product [Pedinophyceae sp. YPF-701]|nr:unnamed protein product [Pedinophyceae sp. YPF-701]
MTAEEIKAKESEDVEDVSSSDSEGEQEDKGDGSGRGRQSRSEKKARKAVQKLGMKLVPDVDRVAIRKSKNIIFNIRKPDVYRAPGSDTYVIFGEAKIEDMSALQAQAQLEQFKQAQAQAAQAVQPSTDAAAGEEDDGEAVDESGLDPKDVDLIVQQAGVSRAKAVGALRKTDGDIVSAIMELTM